MSKCALIKTRVVTIHRREKEIGSERYREKRALGTGDYSRLIPDFKSKSQSKGQCISVIWICGVRAKQDSKHRLCIIVII